MQMQFDAQIAYKKSWMVSTIYDYNNNYVFLAIINQLFVLFALITKEKLRQPVSQGKVINALDSCIFLNSEKILWFCIENHRLIFLPVFLMNLSNFAISNFAISNFAISNGSQTCRALKSVNSNFTLAVHSPKLWQAKTHFLSHFGGKKEKKYG